MNKLCLTAIYTEFITLQSLNLKGETTLCDLGEQLHTINNKLQIIQANSLCPRANICSQTMSTLIIYKWRWMLAHKRFTNKCCLSQIICLWQNVWPNPVLGEMLIFGVFHFSSPLQVSSGMKGWGLQSCLSPISSNSFTSPTTRQTDISHNHSPMVFHEM